MTYNMTTVMVGMHESLLVLESSNTNRYKIHGCLKGTHPQSVALDPGNPNRAYCGTFGDGLWKTDDGGQTWNSIVGKDSRSSGSSNSGGIIPSNNVISVSVSHRE